MIGEECYFARDGGRLGPLNFDQICQMDCSQVLSSTDVAQCGPTRRGC
jgi:hypothetical protein